MSNEVDPVAGSWYEHIERGQKFEVLDVDDERGVIEVQYANGEIDEMDIDEWYDLEIEPIEIPEEWTGQSDLPSGRYEGDEKGYKPSDDAGPRSRPPKRPWEDNEEEENGEEKEDDWADGLDENDRSRDED